MGLLVQSAVGMRGATACRSQACRPVWWGDLQMWFSMLLLGLTLFGLLGLFILACERF
jgi:hypothetical protein